jgi:hypothetical protein
MWLPDGVAPQSRPRAMISTPKIMVLIFRCPLGFPVITTLPSNTKFTADYFCNGVIPKIVEGLSFDLANSATTDVAQEPCHPEPSPEIDYVFEEIPDPPN